MQFFTKDKAFYRSFIRLCVTLMLEQAVILSVNLADNMMLGSYSEAALSGVAAVNQIQFVYQQLVYGVSNAMIVLGSQYWGQKRADQVRRLSSIGTWSAVAIGVALFIGVSLFPHGSLALFTPSEDFAREGMNYLSIIRFSYIPFAISAIMLGTMRIAESVKIALRVSIISLVINVSINFVLITGRFGAPEMGVRGAAIGTLTARVIECIIIAFFLFKKEDKLSMQPKDFLHIDRAMLKDFIRVGVPVVISAAMWGFANAVQTIILGHMNESAIAAQSISSTMFLLLKVTSVGAASAASILVGQAIGAGDFPRIREYTRTLQLIFVGIGIVLGIALFLIRIPLLAVYNISEETRILANAYMIIQSIVIFTMSYQMPVNIGIIRGGGDTRYVLILDTISIWCIVVPISVLAAFVWKLSPIIVIICLNADQVFKCVPAFIRVNGYKWIRTLTRPE